LNIRFVSDPCSVKKAVIAAAAQVLHVLTERFGLQVAGPRPALDGGEQVPGARAP
jgi:hypothetical protein